MSGIPLTAFSLLPKDKQGLVDWSEVVKLKVIDSFSFLPGGKEEGPVDYLVILWSSQVQAQNGPRKITISPTSPVPSDIAGLLDWQEVARFNPDYQAYVTAERSRLGENHPLFLTQYRLLPVHGSSRFLSFQQRAQLQGEHPRRHTPLPERICVAGIDLAGEAEEADGSQLRAIKPRQDATVVTIAELAPAGDSVTGQPVIRVLEHYWWTGKKHTDVYTQLLDLLKNVWRCRKITIDSTGVGQPVSSFLRQALGSRVVPFTFTAASKSELGFELLAAINSGCLKVYAADGSPEYQEFWFEMEKAKSHYRPSRTMNFYLDAAEGHDDFLMSLALVVKAASRYTPRGARGGGKHEDYSS